MVSHTRRTQTALHCLQLHHHRMHTQVEDRPPVCTMDPSAGPLCAKSFLDKKTKNDAVSSVRYAFSGSNELIFIRMCHDCKLTRQGENIFKAKIKEKKSRDHFHVVVKSNMRLKSTLYFTLMSIK